MCVLPLLPFRPFLTSSFVLRQKESRSWMEMSALRRDSGVLCSIPVLEPNGMKAVDFALKRKCLRQRRDIPCRGETPLEDASKAFTTSPAGKRQDTNRNKGSRAKACDGKKSSSSAHLRRRKGRQQPPGRGHEISPSLCCVLDQAKSLRRIT